MEQAVSSVQILKEFYEFRKWTFHFQQFFSEWQEYCDLPSGHAPKNEFSLYKNNPQLFTLKFLCPCFLWNSVY